MKLTLPEKNKLKREVYIMYDTYFGASEGLKLYKKKHCFEPYIVKWRYIEKNKDKKENVVKIV